MVTRPVATHEGPQRVLVFGSQAPSLDAAVLESLHSTIASTDGSKWLFTTVAELPQIWDNFVSQFPECGSGTNSQMLSQLVSWTKTGKLSTDLTALPSIILSPLVVVTHLAEYMSISSQIEPFFIEALGFCTGFLSAIAASLSQDQHQIESYGAIVIRLAMIIGGIVDLQEQTNEQGPSKCLAAAWNSSEARLALDSTLARFPETYISVTFDKHRVTITTPEKTAASLQQELRKAGITTAELSLRGRFHSGQYADIIGKLEQYFSSKPSLCLPDASHLLNPMRSNSGDGAVISSGTLHGHALRVMLGQHCNWYEAFRDLKSSRLSHPTEIISFGQERCVPQAVLNELDSSAVKLRSAAQVAQSLRTSVPEIRRDDIAVIGMSIKVAGADDVSEFYDLLLNGDSQAKEVPMERIIFETAFREKELDRKWFANMINNPDAFDHKFFKKSAREAAQMDPQQRQMLQSAYQALEQSGYMNVPESEREKSMGCYIGVCSADYENNVASHAATAFSATGNLKSFIAGKISHYFGWTSSAMCIDTACSSSLVAIHLACKAILSGECRAALAGGANIMTNPLWFENLAAASFLSKTGQCKPFDDAADGYCRGEGFATVVLKRMSEAVADGDQIIGVIPSSAVLQNQNCTPIFVPNSPSLGDLFRKVLDESALKPSQIGYIEAHGTGTQVGDPAEYESIKNVLGGKTRDSTLVLGSTKGLVGHTECTSGAVSLVKTLLVVGQKVIPPQRSFTKVNPHINMQREDNIEIVTKARKWDSGFRAALINNYGASGSNASMIVTQAPRLLADAPSSQVSAAHSIDVPFRICGKDARAIRTYAGKLRQALVRSTEAKDDISVADLAFNVGRQSNPSLEQAWVFSSRTKEHLIEQLAQVEKVGIEPGQIAVPASRPVILCFGGQISTWIGLSRDVYNGVAVFRSWLDECDDAIRAMGCDSIFPGIFEKEPISDPVKLQTMLFAIQYACAKTWSESGVQPVAVVGHSFGELTSLCISGVLSLKDTIRLIAGRAKIIKDSWGPESGSMVAIEADHAQVQALLTEVEPLCKEAGEATPTIACFNGPTSFTVAGSTKAIDIIVQSLVQTAKHLGMRHKRLNVTNAFHSTLVEPLKQQLVELGQGLKFNDKPVIPLEQATEFQSSRQLTAQYVADHMRDPVYFDHAVRRLANKYPGAVWLEAGSNSTIANMASRALGQPKGHFFQPVNITSNSGLQFLTNVTMGLWSEGLSQLTYWAHHRKQTYEYTPLLLPAYQFEQSRHWVELKVPKGQEQPSRVQQETPDEVPNTLWTFSSFQDEQKQSATFNINTAAEVYQELMSGHVIAKTAPILPATVLVNMVADALASICPDVSEFKLQPVLRNVENQSPVCIDPTRTVSLQVQGKDANRRTWDWQMSSMGGGKTTTHATGSVVYVASDDAESNNEFSRCQRLVGHQRCKKLLQDDEADIIQGRRYIYNAFADVVDYPEPYQGVHKLVGGNDESAGRVSKSHSVEGWIDPHLSDSFSQVGGIWVNCMTNSSPEDLFLATGFEKWMRAPQLALEDYRQIKKWDVFGTHHAESENVWISDLFIFDSTNGKLVEVILGIHYHRVARASMSKILRRLTHPSALSPGLAPLAQDTKVGSHDSSVTEPSASSAAPSAAPIGAVKQAPAPKAAGGPSEGQKVVAQARALLADMAGIEGDQIVADTQLADIGIDSLMGMELARELEGLFKCTLPVDDLMNVFDFGQLTRLVQEKLGVSVEAEDTQAEAEKVDSSDDDSGYGTRTPTSTAVASLAIPDIPAKSQTLELSPSIVMESFEETKELTDKFITDFRCAGYMEEVLPRQTQLCISLTIEAFEKLGCSLRTAKPGERLARIPCVKDQRLLTNYLYGMLEKEARLIDIKKEGSEEIITRTAMSISVYKPSSEIIVTLLREFPDHEWANKLTNFAGSQLAEVISGKQDGLKLIFGTEEGRKLVTGLYGDSLLNKLANCQMQDVISRLISKMPKDQGPLKILELGAGTGGTARGMAAMLAKLGAPVEYTFTDLSGSFVAQARKNMKEYPFMKFRVHNIEHVPADDLIGTQHIVLGSNAIHATHNLLESTKNVRKMLRPDGFLMMLEMTDPVYWVDMIFGLFEGWWMFEDGRNHAIAHESVWQRDLQSAGYGHVDWTDGYLPEIKIQKVFLAMASGPRYERRPLPPLKEVKTIVPPTTAHRAMVEAYVTAHTRDFTGPSTVPASASKKGPGSTTVLVTGASGSLGSHLVALLASLPNVKSVVCLNRRSTTEAETRQQRAMAERGILLDAACQSKLQVLQTDTSKPLLGLSADQYEGLVDSVTHIIHNAWPMSGKRPLAAMEGQFTVMRNLVDLANKIASRTPGPVGFQLVSSIAVVGHYPMLPEGDRVVPETRMPLDAVLPNGYGEAKFVCERILDETLHRFPDRFRAMSVRLGQVAGSRVSGYWNPMEHLSFLFKSSQTLRAFPAFEGDLCWTPVEDVAGTLADLVLRAGAPHPHPVYHIDNPRRQPWAEMVPVVAEALGIPSDGVVPFREWIRRVRSFPGAMDADNPAARLIDFLDDNFIRMSCGGLLLDTKQSCEHSPTLSAVGPISPFLAKKYIQAWKGIGFLN